MKKYTEKQLIEAVKNSKSIVQVLRRLGYKVNGGSIWRRVKKEIQSLDTSHFDGGKSKLVRYTLEEILKKDSKYYNISSLKKRLVEEKILEYVCVKCKNTGKWQGENITLQLDHINGIRDDHSVDNLRFLCPNCHSQTSTFAGRNKGE